jgi:hypothetical protein
MKDGGASATHLITNLSLGGVIAISPLIKKITNN